MRYLLGVLVLLASPVWGGEPQVVGVEAIQAGDGSWRFDVTVRHADEGWEHYADRWQVVGPDGVLLGERVLLHPHETEQPFTRSLSGVLVPDGTAQVTVTAHDSVHGWGPPLVITLP